MWLTINAVQGQQNLQCPVCIKALPLGQRRKETNTHYIQHTDKKNSLQLRFLVSVLVGEIFPICSYGNSSNFQTSPLRHFLRIYLTVRKYATCICFTVWTTKPLKNKKKPHPPINRASFGLQFGKPMSNILKSRMN